MKKRTKEFFKNLLLKERSPQKLAASISVGIYIAFSPFPGFHTSLVFLLGWLFKLNIPIILASSILVNNPWTMIPVYGAGFVVGDWICNAIFGHNFVTYNPGWMHWLNDWICQYTGSCGLSLWSFLIGGNILGIGFALLFYPILLYIFKKLSHEHAS